MNKKEGVIKKACFIGLVLFAVLGLMSFAGCGGGGGDGGGGGGEGTTPQTFTTSNMFPLTSGWETDHWTLFVDVADHDINGVMTRAMVDTRGPIVYYWTNDADGLRLHVFMDDEGTDTLFSEPVVFADSICKVGDKKEVTVTMGGEEFNLLIEMVGVEDVTVPAGTFLNCLKLSIFLYPSAEPPSAYGYETLWLAENVGFVKAEADENAISEFFVDAGETRQLLSYHITDPAGLSKDQQAVRAAYIELNERFNDEDLDGVLSMVSEDYFDERCRDKDEQEISWGNFFDRTSDNYFFTTIESSSIDGDNAFVLREGLNTWLDDATSERNWNWDRVLRRFHRENGEWKYYGAQLGITPSWYDVYARTTSYDGEHIPIGVEFIDCSDGEFIDTPAPISSLTVTGPAGSDIVDLDLMPSWYSDPNDPWRAFWNPDTLQNAASGFYTFRVEEPDGDFFEFTDYLEATPHMALPILVSPAEFEVVAVGDVILDWEPVDQAETYRVDMRYRDDDGVTWQGMPNINTDDTKVTVTLNPDTRYQWRVRAWQPDVFEERDNESRSDWRDFSTYDVFTMYGYLQYRTFSDAGNNQYRGWLEFAKNNNPLDESDITEIVLEDSSGSEVSISSTTFYASSNFWGEWNDSTSSVDFSGPYSSAGFSIKFPDETNLSAGDYTYEATTSLGDLLTLTNYFPGGKPPSPVVDVASMNYQWLGNGDLYLTWAVPTGTFDQFRIVLADQGWDDLLYVRLPPDKEELTVPSELIQQITDLKNPSSAIWQVQTRLYTTTADHNNYARGYSDNVEIPWSGAGG